MFGAEWVYYLALSCVSAIIGAVFIWRSKAGQSKIQVAHMGDVIKSVPAAVPLKAAYLIILILVDVGVMESWPWYTVASAILCLLQTMRILML